MARIPRLDRRSLRFQLVVTLLVIAICIIVLTAVPITRLVHNELERQAHARLEQAVAITRALYMARQREIGSLALLTAQRPTLRDLLARADLLALPPYLDDLRLGARLDSIVIVDAYGHPVASATGGSALAPAASETLKGAINFGGQAVILPIDNGTGLMLAAESAVTGETDGGLLGWARVALLLDSDFVAALKTETGLEHTLLSDAARLVSTLPPDTPLVWVNGSAETPPLTYTPDGHAFYTARLVLSQATGVTLADAIALPADDLVATAARVQTTLWVSSGLFALLVAALGYFLADRVTRPLQQLAAASDGMGRGDLTTPLSMTTDVAEVTRLARTLEQMRRRLLAAHNDLSRAKAWSENLIATLTEGVVTVDTSGRITSFSSGAERILGWRSQDVVGRRYDQVFRSADDQPVTVHLAPGELERVRVLTRDNRPKAITMLGGALMARQDNGWEQAHVFRDMTAEEEAQRLREFFLANVSHEFKTPLAALRTAIELLAGDWATLSEIERRELMDSTLLGVMRLEELVDNLLSSASIQSGQFELRLQSINLEALAEEVLLTTRPLLAMRGQRLDLDIPADLPVVWADPRRVTQVLINLISNASKYGYPQRPIRLRAEWQTDLLVQVINAGPGIEADKQALLFRPFQRSTNQNDTAGVGLGLSIVKTIVEKHGGQVGVDSTPNGATFWFTLPLALHEQPILLS